MFLLRLALKFGAGLLLLALMMGLLTGCGGGGGRSAQASATVFHTALKTSDGALQLEVTITPNQRGSNEFLVTVQGMGGGQRTLPMSVQLSTMMVDMDMGVDSVALQQVGEGEFSARGNVAMVGNVEIRIVVRTADGLLHTAAFDLRTGR